MSMIAHSAGAAARGLPVYLPLTEEAATPETFTLVFDNPTDSGHEAGAGGGLIGPNLVFEQVGGIPGAADGGRLMNGTSQYFKWTQAALDALLKGTEWTVMLKLDSMNGDKTLCMFGPAITDNLGIYGLQAFLTDTSSTRMRFLNGHSTANELIAAVWYKNGLVHIGWTDTTVTPGIPTGWDFFPFSQRAAWAFTGYSTTTFAVTPHVFSSTYEYQACKAKQFWCSKLGLQAAPV